MKDALHLGCSDLKSRIGSNPITATKINPQLAKLVDAVRSGRTVPIERGVRVRLSHWGHWNVV